MSRAPRDDSSRTSRKAGRKGGAAAPGDRPRTPPPRKAAPHLASPPLPPGHPAFLFCLLLAAAGVVVSASFRIADTDFWQHLVVGREIWRLHAVPQQHLWTWANYGVHEVLPSWGFRALLWPFWEIGGVTGLFAWRWLTTLLAFGFAWLAARRMGARGLTPLVVAVWCSLFYRFRSQARPETLAAVLMAVEIWLLERDRARRTVPPIAASPPRSFRADWTLIGLVAVAWAWANSHISYFLFFLLLGAHLIEAAWRDRARARSLVAVFVASLAAACVNPFGLRALWQPFDYFLHLSREPMFRGIGELQPLAWTGNQTNGVFVMLVAWPLLLLWRWRRRGFDVVETIACAFFTAYMVNSQRFLGSYAVVAAAYAARDLEEFVRARRWAAWTARAWPRAALAALAIVGVGAAEWMRPNRPLSISVDMSHFPVQAMDFMQQHGVRGHGFSQTRIAGYQLWRFWPDRERLPFMDIHQTGTTRDRTLYTQAMERASGWAELDRGRFDYVVLDPHLADSLLAGLDADTTMRLVFLDDTGALYVRARGTLAAVADSFGYRWLGAGAARNAAVFAAAAEDSTVHRAVAGELDRSIAASPLAGRALSMRATLEQGSEEFDAARRDLLQALRIEPRTPFAHSRLAQIAMVQGRPDEAIREFQMEQKLFGARPGIEFALGLVSRGAGREAEARRHFEREIKRYPGSPSAAAASEALASPP